MALVALHQCVGSYQREAVLMISDGIQRHLPTLHGVAALAIGAKLATMYIRMAIGAVGADILENQAGVTLHARHFLVHAPQGIPV